MGGPEGRDKGLMGGGGLFSNYLSLAGLLGEPVGGCLNKKQGLN